jgi:DUF4097 and DUF4098 domain-containing protein YvlB
MNLRMAAVGGLLLALALAGCEAMNVSNTVSSPTVTGKQTTWQVPLEGATGADVAITSQVSAVNVEPLGPDTTLLLDANLEYVGTLTTTAEGDAEKTVVISDEIQSYSYNGPPLAFNISVNRLPTLGLDVTASSGDVNLNLAQFNLTRLNVSTASGKVEGSLPAGSGVYTVNTVTASGDITYTAADDAAIQFESIQTSSGNVTINGGNGGALVGTMVNTSSGTVTLNFGQHPISAGFRVGTSSGNIVVNVPDGVPVRLEVVSNASGTVSVPAGMAQTNGEGDLGVWQTADYPETGQRIEIIVTSTASGDVTVQ